VLVLVQVEEAGHGGAVAAPLARQLLAYYYGEPEPEIVPPSLAEVAQGGTEPGRRRIEAGGQGHQATIAAFKAISIPTLSQSPGAS